MTDTETDLQGSALLLAVVERHGGDLQAAFAVLCAHVDPHDLTGETFERALGRAVRKLFGQPAYVLEGIGAPRDDAANGSAVA